MESLLPSEVARLVYGYLLEESCTEAAEKFLETSPHLKECLDVSRKGKKFQTRFEGRNLLAILDVLTQVKTQAQIVAAELPQNSLLNKKLLDLLALLSVEVSPCLESEDETSELQNSESCNKTPISQSFEVDSNENVNYTECLSPSSEKNVSLKRDNGHLNKIATDSQASSSLFNHITEVVTVDDQNDILPDEDSDMEIVLDTSKDDKSSPTANGVSSESASPKRIKLVDATNSDDEIIECLTPEVDIIDLDAEDSDSSQSSSSLQYSRADSSYQSQDSVNQLYPNQKKRRNKKKKKKSKVKNTAVFETSSSRVPCSSASQASSNNARPNAAPQPSTSFNNSTSLGAPKLFQGRPVLKTPLITMYSPTYVRGTPLRFLSHLPRTPVGNPGWIRDSMSNRSPARPTVPIVVNRQVIHTSSSFGMLGSGGRSSAPDGNFHMVTEKVVTQMMASRVGNQPRISQSVLSNQAVVRPALISVLPREPFI